MGISTAAAGLYQKGFLALPFPSKDPKSLGRTVLVWGGSSSVGSCAIQLAVASGANVVTTASPSNFEYIKKLGASQCFDYHDDDVEDQIVEALKGKTVVGAYHAVGADGAVQACARIVDRTKGKAIVVTVRGVPEEGIPSSVRAKASKYYGYRSRLARLLNCTTSRFKCYIRRGQRRGTVHLARVPAEGARRGIHSTGARSAHRGRGTQVCASRAGQAEEGSQCEESRRY